MSTGQVNGEVLTAFVVGDTEVACNTVLELARAIGLDAVDTGRLKNARYREPLALLNIRGKRMTEENEKRVRAFYEATVPGHREALWSLQAPHVVYDLPAGMPVGGGHFEGLLDVTERFLARFYEVFDVRFVAEEFITAGEQVVAIGRISGTTRSTAVTVDVPFVHVWTVRDGRLQRLRGFTDTAVLARALAER